jgi:hypothetical protein
MGEIQDLLKIASPDTCASGSDKALKKFKQLLKKAENAKQMLDLLKENKDDQDIKSINPRSLSSYKLTYDAQTNQLEPVYYWLLDFVEDAGYDIEKLTDNFMATPGSGSFDEYGRKIGTMQEKASYYMGAINQVTKSILQLIYDLKEFELRLQHYKDAKSEDKQKKEAGLLALKQVWLDNVDMKRGTGSIHQMSYQVGFTTLRELFMICNSLEDVKKNELVNEQVKRVLLPRVSEFLNWKDLSEKELNKRFEIEKSYLRTQVQTLKLYTSWAKPYLRSAEQLRQKGFETNAAMVNAFSTSMFELTFMAKQKAKPEKPFDKHPLKRNYNSCLLISFTYRGHYSQRVSQRGDMAYGFGGRVDITFDSYSINDQELELFKKLREKKDREIGFSFIQEESDKSLEQLQEDIDHFLDEDKKEEKEEKKQDDVNPFSALFSIFSGGLFKSGKNNKQEIKSLKDIPKDNYVEQYVRQTAAINAKKFLYAVYDVYKKAHGMASSPESFHRNIPEDD